MSLSIRLLGAPRLERDGAQVDGPRGRKTWALFAYLLSCDVPPTRERLAGLLFPEAADPLGALRWTVADARRVLGEDGALTGDPLRLGLAPDVAVDLVLAHDGRRHDAGATFEGELLEGHRFPTAPAFELWLEGERAHLQARAIEALHERSHGLLADGDASEALRCARRLVELDPLDENHHLLLVRCLAAVGQPTAARDAADRAIRTLRTALGVEPSSALRTVADALDRPVPVVASPAVVGAQLEAAEAAIAAGSWTAGVELHRQALTTARQLDRAELLAPALVGLGSALVHAVRGLDEEGTALLHEGVVVATRVGDRTLAARASREIAYIEFLRARYASCRRWLHDAEQLAAEDPTELAWIRLLEGACDTDAGAYASASRHLTEAVSLAEQHGLDRAGAFACSFLGRWHLLRRELPAAERALRRSLELARSSGWTSLLPWPESLLGEVRLLQDDLVAAEDSFHRSYAMGQQLGDACWESMGLRGLGVAAARTGDVDRARTLLEQAPRRCVALPDSYLWIAAYGLEALSTFGAANGLPSTARWVGELERTAARSGLRELHVRALLHRAKAGDTDALAASQALGADVDNPALHEELVRLPR